MKFKCRVCGGHYELDQFEQPCPLCNGVWEESYWIEGSTVKAIAQLQGRSSEKDELMKAIDDAWETDQELRRKQVAMAHGDAPNMGGWQTPRDRVVIEQVMLNYPLKNPKVVEVGVYAGGCTNVFFLARPDTRYVGIDNWEGAPNLKEDFLHETRFFKESIEVITGDSVKVGKEWDCPIDIILIDGSHDYPDVKADIDNFVPWVKSDGIVMVDDYVKYSDVKKAVDETLFNNNFELVRLPEERIKGGEKLIIFRKK